MADLKPFWNTCAPVVVYFRLLRGFSAESEQQPHTYGTGRCYALHPSLSADARTPPATFLHVLTTQLAPFCYFFTNATASNGSKVIFCGRRSRRSRASITALFSLFEKAMLSASQNDITPRARDWSPGLSRTHLKTQCGVDAGGGAKEDTGSAAATCFMSGLFHTPHTCCWWSRCCGGYRRNGNFPLLRQLRQQRGLNSPR